MTFQPPPPPPPPAGPPPGGQPPGAWGPPPGGAARPGFNAANVNPLDWGILACGLLAFIFSFISYYTFSVSDKYCGGTCVSVSENAWHGFFGWFAMLLALIGSALVALELFMPHVTLPFPGRLAGLACYALATICVILALFIIPGYLGYSVPSGVDEGHGFGYWISLIVIIAGLVLSLMRFQQGGGKLPGALANMPNIGARGPGGTATPPPAAPPAGYGQPPVGPPPAGPPPAGPPPGYGPPPQP